MVLWIRPDLLQITIIKKLKAIFYNWINPKSDGTVAAFQASIFHSHQISEPSSEVDFQVSPSCAFVYKCREVHKP